VLEKIVLKNYKNFVNTTIAFNEGRNIFVGENGVGKSSLLQAIRLVLSGSYSQIDTLGLESLFNAKVVSNFFTNNPESKNLPELIIELYFAKKYVAPNSYEINGKYNTDQRECDGLQLKISANREEFSDEINEVLSHDNPTFPFDYYKVEFRTFANQGYNNYQKRHKLNFAFIDTTSMNQTVATKHYVEQLFANQTGNKKQQISHDFRELAKGFSQSIYQEYGIDEPKDDYKLKVRSTTEKHFSDILTAHKNEISIENLGLGERVILGVKSSIASAADNVQIVLIEEPENHLSHLNVHRLIERIENDGNNDKQIFIATHSNMIASRLELKNLILIGDSGQTLTLEDLTAETSRFFAKAPNTNVLNFILAKKTILVEGDAEFILMEKFYEEQRKLKPFDEDVVIISCGGKTFKRYLEIAKILNKKVAVITDNDGNFAKNIKENYSDFSENNIKICSDENDKNHTFEVCLYQVNKDFYDTVFANRRMTNGVQSYLLTNKAEAAFRVLELEEYPENYVVPAYIMEAIEWISQSKE
jgi:predicted ATP-dependent endonuclease of OLD family